MKDYMIREENYEASMNEIVESYLNPRKTEDYFEGYDQNRLRCALYRADSPKATIVFLHGFTESCEKFDELIYYFLLHDYSVLLPEHRGHGKSYRLISDMTVTHIRRFSEYIDDLECFLRYCEAAGLLKKPLYLYAHSMGGAVGAIYMERHPEVFQKAVLTSPMIAPCTAGVPVFLGRLIAGAFILFGKGKQRSFTSGKYPGYERFETSSATSEARFSRYERKKRETPYLQNYSPTYSWVFESLGVTGSILRRNRPERIKAKTLIFAAQQDTLVKLSAQKKLAERLKDGRLMIIEGAKHEIYASKDEVLKKYLDELFAFLDN